MATVTNAYDSLYTNLKNRYTVIYDSAECTVGEYMLKKAGHTPKTNALAPVKHNEHHGLTGIVEYVNHKFSVTNPPKKEKTIRRFPLRTSFSALLSSVAACALILSCGILALTGAFRGIAPTVENTENPAITEDYDGDLLVER